jgi:UDP-glucose 4-epimerase
VGRREGDITSAYANTDKANNILGWSTIIFKIHSSMEMEQKVRSYQEKKVQAVHLEPFF